MSDNMCRCCGRSTGGVHLLADAFYVAPDGDSGAFLGSNHLCRRCHNYVGGFMKTIMYPSAHKMWAMYWQGSISLPSNHVYVQDRVQSILDAASSDNSRIARAFVPYVPGVVVEYMLENTSVANEVLAKNLQQTVDGVILLADVSGYTALAETICEEQGDQRGVEVVVTKFLNKYFTRLVELVYEYGGDVVKFAGDAVLCIWKPQVPKSVLLQTDLKLRSVQIKQIFELYAQAATLCAIRAATGLKETTIVGDHKELALTLHCGLASGKISIFSVGGENCKKEILLTGAPVLGAGDASSLAKSGTVVLEDSVKRQVSKMTRCSPVLEKNSSKAHKFFGEIPLEQVKYWKVEDHTVSIQLDRQQNENIMQLLHAHLPPVSILLEMFESFIPVNVAKRITDNEKLSNDLRSVSVLFLKISSAKKSIGYSTGQESLLQEIFVRCQRVVTRNEGMIRQFIVDDKGCQLIVCFGVSNHRHKDDPTRAVDTAIELHATLCHVNYGDDSSIDLDIHTGVTTGRAFCGPVGSWDRGNNKTMRNDFKMNQDVEPAVLAERREFAVVGDRVNLAARLMNYAQSQNTKLLCDESTYNAVSITASRRNRTKLGFIEEIMVKGKKNKVKVYGPVVQGTNEETGPSLSPRYTGSATFDDSSHIVCFGREEEQKKLDGYLSAFSKQILKNPYILIVGEEGMGKTNILKWAINEVSSRPDYESITLLGSQFDGPTGRHSVRLSAQRVSYRGLRMVLWDLFEINATEDPKKQLANLVTRLQDPPLVAEVEDRESTSSMRRAKNLSQDEFLKEPSWEPRARKNRHSLPNKCMGPLGRAVSFNTKSEQEQSAEGYISSPDITGNVQKSEELSKYLHETFSAKEVLHTNEDKFHSSSEGGFTSDSSAGDDTRGISPEKPPFENPPIESRKNRRRSSKFTLKKRSTSSTYTHDSPPVMVANVTQLMKHTFSKGIRSDSRSSSDDGMDDTSTLPGSPLTDSPDAKLSQRVTNFMDHVKLVSPNIDYTTVRVFLESDPDDLANCILQAISSTRPMNVDDTGNISSGSKPEQVISDLVCLIAILVLHEKNTAGKKICICIDEIESLDEDSLNLLGKLVRPNNMEYCVPGLMVLANVRPSAVEAVLHKVRLNYYWTYQVYLTPLKENAVAQLLQHSFKVSSWPTAVLEKIVKSSNGLPFWAIEYVRGLIAQRFIIPDAAGAGWTFDSSRMSDIEQVFPDGLEGAILQQYDNLKEEIWKQAFKWACILNTDFTVEIMRDLLVSTSVYDKLADLVKMSHVKTESIDDDSVDTLYSIWDDVNVHGLGLEHNSLLQVLKQLRTKTGRLKFNLREVVEQYILSHEAHSLDTYQRIVDALVGEKFLQKSSVNDDDVYHVAHEYYHHTVYKMIPPKERDWYHLQCAKYLSGAESISPLIVADHFKIANANPEAVDWFHKAAVFEYTHAGSRGCIYVSRIENARELVKEALQLSRSVPNFKHADLIPLKILLGETCHYLGKFTESSDALHIATVLASHELSHVLNSPGMKRIGSSSQLLSSKIKSMRKRNLTTENLPISDIFDANTRGESLSMDSEVGASVDSPRMKPRYSVEDLSIDFPRKPRSSSVPDDELLELDDPASSFLDPHHLPRPRMRRKSSLSTIQSAWSSISRRSESSTNVTNLPLSENATNLLHGQAMLLFQAFYGFDTELLIDRFKILAKTFTELMLPNKCPSVIHIVSSLVHMRTKTPHAGSFLEQALKDIKLMDGLKISDGLVWLYEICALCSLSKAKFDECDFFLMEIKSHSCAMAFVCPRDPFARLRQAEVLFMSVEVAIQFKSLSEAEILRQELADLAKLLHNPQVSAWSIACNIVLAFKRQGVLISSDAMQHANGNATTTAGNVVPASDSADGFAFLDHVEMLPDADKVLIGAIKSWIFSDLGNPLYDLSEAQKNATLVWNAIHDECIQGNLWYLGLSFELLFYAFCQMVTFGLGFKSTKSDKKLSFQASSSNIKVLLKAFRAFGQSFPAYIPVIHRCKGIYYVLRDKYSKAHAQFVKASRYANQRSMPYEDKLNSYLAKRFTPGVHAYRPRSEELVNYGFKKYFQKAFDIQICAWKEKKISAHEIQTLVGTGSPSSKTLSGRGLTDSKIYAGILRPRSSAGLKPNGIALGLPPTHPSLS